MPIEIIVPRLGWSMNEGTFAGWLKNDGDVVYEGDLLFTLESDKATQDVETFDAGILRLPPNAPQTGETIMVGQVIGYLCTENEPSPTSLPEFVPTEGLSDKSTGTVAPTTAEQTAMQKTPQDYVAGPAARRLAREKGLDLAAVAGTGPRGRITRHDVENASRQGDSPSTNGLRTDAQASNNPATNGNSNRVRVSPRAACKAAELGVDVTQIIGTGRGGRIRERDVLAHAEQRMSPTPIANASVTAAPTNQLRHIIADRMLASSRQTAPVTLTARVDATNLVALRGQFKQSRTSDGIVPSFSDLFVKLAAIALARHPEIRCQWTDKGLVMPVGIHICVAVQTDAGLIVPVLRDVDQLSLSQVSQRLGDLIGRTRRRQITPDELEGGVFTVSNLGQFRVDAFTPALNMPQAAILGIGRIRSEPSVHLGEIAVREMGTLSLTFDHRVIDGTPAARFLDTLVELVELPAPSLIG